MRLGTGFGRAIVAITLLALAGCAKRAELLPPPPPPPAIAPEPSPPPPAELPWEIAPGAGAPETVPTISGGGGGFVVPARTVSRAPLVWCDITEDAQTVAVCETYRMARRALADGAGTLKVPQDMTVGAPPSTVRLAIAFDPQSRIPDREVASLPGRSVRISLKVARYMVAQLSGANFKIVPAEPVRQDLLAASNATWDWQVSAEKPAGPRLLTLKTWVEVKVPDGGLMARDVKATDYPVNVKVRAVDAIPAIAEDAKQASDGVVKLLGIPAAILGALTALIVAWRKFG